MRKHILLERSHRFPVVTEVLSDDWVYSRQLGAWVSVSDPDTLMVNSQPQPKPPQPSPRPKPRPMSKKMDIETGEDMKGT